MGAVQSIEDFARGSYKDVGTLKAELRDLFLEMEETAALAKKGAPVTVRDRDNFLHYQASFKDIYKFLLQKEGATSAVEEYLTRYTRLYNVLSRWMNPKTYENPS